MELESRLVREYGGHWTREREESSVHMDLGGAPEKLAKSISILMLLHVSATKFKECRA